MALDLNAWIEEVSKDANLSQQDRDTLLGVVSKNQRIQQNLEGYGLRQSDYDRKMNAMKSEHQTKLEEIAAKEQEISTFQKSLGDWYGENNGKFNKALGDLETMRVNEARLQERMKTLAARHGIPEEELNLPAPTAEVKPAPTAQPTFDEKKYVSRDEAATFERNMALYQADLADLMEEHRETFGSRLKDPKGLIATAMKEKKSIRQVWEEREKVGERRAQQAEAAVQKRIDDAVKESELKIRSESNLPAPRPDAPHSPVVDRFAKARTDQPKDPARGFRSAVAAFQQGKYREGAA